MKTIKAHKAQMVSVSLIDEINPIAIIVERTLPTLDTLPQMDAMFLADAQKLENALHDTLPGGTYDRLAGLMLQRKATHFRVAHQEVVQA